MKHTTPFPAHSPKEMPSNILPKSLYKPEQCFVTIAFAQSLDGSITQKTGSRTHISSAESMILTHHLRALHDGILIGIETALIDDPHLTVRLVEGEHPRPIILDSHLRLPDTAQILSHPKNVWIFTTQTACTKKERTLRQKGAVIIRVGASDQNRVCLNSVLAYLYAHGIQNVMVEGGAQIITSFIQDQYVDHMVITIAPILMGGVNVLSQLNGSPLPLLHNVNHCLCDKDIIISGTPKW